MMTNNNRNVILTLMLLILVEAFGGLTFISPSSQGTPTFNITKATNGQRLTSNQEGWISSDILSTINATSFYVTIENLTGSAAGIGPTEVADTYCFPSFYPTTWTGFIEDLPGSYSCYSDFLTLYTYKPDNSNSEISSTIMVSHTYKYDIFPDQNSGCYELTITDMTQNSTIIEQWNYGGVCANDRGSEFSLSEGVNMAIYFELESAGFVSFCLQNETQYSLGNCNGTKVTTTSTNSIFAPLPQFPESNGNGNSNSNDSSDDDSDPAIISTSDDTSNSALISTATMNVDPGQGSSWFNQNTKVALVVMVCIGTTLLLATLLAGYSSYRQRMKSKLPTKATKANKANLSDSDEPKADKEIIETENFKVAFSDNEAYVTHPTNQ